MNPAETKKNSH